MYLGPSQQSKGFRFYDPETRTTFESRDVIWFDATPFYAKVQEPTPQGTQASDQDPFEVVPEQDEPFEVKFPESPPIPPSEKVPQEQESPSQVEPRRSRRLQGLEPSVHLTFPWSCRVAPRDYHSTSLATSHEVPGKGPMV